MKSPSSTGPRPQRYTGAVTAAPNRAKPVSMQLAVGEHHFEGAHVREVIAVRRVAEAALHRVADEAAGRAGAGGVHPQPRSALAEIVVQLLLGDAGLDRDVRERFAEVHDPLHAGRRSRMTLPSEAGTREP